MRNENANRKRLVPFSWYDFLKGSTKQRVKKVKVKKGFSREDEVITGVNTLCLLTAGLTASRALRRTVASRTSSNPIVELWSLCWRADALTPQLCLKLQLREFFNRTKAERILHYNITDFGIFLIRVNFFSLLISNATLNPFTLYITPVSS